MSLWLLCLLWVFSCGPALANLPRHDSITYDELNRLKQVTDNRLRGNKITAYGFDAVGNLQLVQQPNNVTNLYQYDTQNRLTNVLWKCGSISLASFGYTLNAVGNRTQLSQSLGVQPTAFTWTYDALRRLNIETATGNSPSGNLTNTFDLVGNRKTRNAALTLSGQSLNYDQNDWLDDDAVPTDSNPYFDARGNTVSYGGVSYGYDWANRLTSKGGTAVVMTYDGDGNRTKKVVGSTTTWYLVAAVNPTGYPQVVEEHTGASPGTLSRRYTYGLDLISHTVSGTTKFFGTDGLGSTRFLTDGNGTLTEHYGYDAYGSIIVSNTTPSTRYLFAGEQWDADLGMYYLRARYYHPDLGRFWTMDTWPGNLRDSLSLHRYLYAADNPVNHTDPSGQFSEGIGGLLVSTAIRATLGGLTGAVIGGTIGGVDAALSSDPNASLWDGIENGATFGLVAGALLPFASPAVLTGVGAVGTGIGAIGT